MTLRTSEFAMQECLLPIRELPPSMDSATSRVLRVPELLELILLALPQKDLLLSQSISQSFRDTVKRSLHIQRSLFFLADPHIFQPLNNFLLLRAFPGYYPTVTYTPTKLLPTMEELAIGRRGSETWKWKLSISFPADRVPSPSCPAVLYPEASWRRMFLSQGPCEELHLVRRWHRSPDPRITAEGGLTMGVFYTQATGGKADWHKNWVSSDRDWHFEGEPGRAVRQDGDANLS